MYKHCNFLLQPLHHLFLDSLSTNLPIKVTEFSKHLPQIGFKIATEYYRHESFCKNMVVMALQSIKFTSADINCSFYVYCIAVWKLQCLKPPNYLFPFCRLQIVWNSWCTQFSPCIWFSLQRRTFKESKLSLFLHSRYLS
jgi:hypothetical protein